MEILPFDYIGPLPPERVQGRHELIDELTRRVTTRTPTALLGPRRFGKTSVLGRLAADLTEATTITVDLMPVQSSLDAARALLAALLDAGATVSQEATQVASSIGINLVALRAEIRATRPSARPDPADAVANLVDTLVQTALRRPTIVVFDEFQQIATVAGGTAVLRAALQHHHKDLGLLFAGSAPSAMRDIFANHDQPFLHQADIVQIEPLTLPAVQQIIDDGFAGTGRQPGAVASLIHDFTAGHPLRTMQAAHATWLHRPAEQFDGRRCRSVTGDERHDPRGAEAAVTVVDPHGHLRELRHPPGSDPYAVEDRLEVVGPPEHRSQSSGGITEQRGRRDVVPAPCGGQARVQPVHRRVDERIDRHIIGRDRQVGITARLVDARAGGRQVDEPHRLDRSEHCGGLSRWLGLSGRLLRLRGSAGSVGCGGASARSLVPGSPWFATLTTVATTTTMATVPAMSQSVEGRVGVWITCGKVAPCAGSTAWPCTVLPASEPHREARVGRAVRLPRGCLQCAERVRVGVAVQGQPILRERVTGDQRWQVRITRAAVARLRCGALRALAALAAASATTAWPRFSRLHCSSNSGSTASCASSSGPSDASWAEVNGTADSAGATSAAPPHWRSRSATVRAVGCGTPPTRSVSPRQAGRGPHRWASRWTGS